MSPSNDRPISPMVGLFAVIVITNLLSLPIARLLGGLDFESLEFRVTEDDIWTAYLWTIFTFVALVGLYFGLGIHRAAREYQNRPMVAYSSVGYDRFWQITFAVGLFLAALMFVQAGFRLPVFAVLGQDYVGFLKMRWAFEKAINGTLFNVALFWMATSNVTIAWLHGSSIGRRLASAGLFLLIGSFDLARSPMGLALLMVLTYRLLWRRIGWKSLAQGIGVASALFVASHYVAGAPEGYGGMGHYLGVRVFYGQWASLPYYFSLFEHARIEAASLVTPAFAVLMGGNAVSTSAARLVMMRMSPEAVDEQAAGVASTFFIGEAYAVAGTAGVILAPVLVMLQIRLVALCFQRLKKTTFNVLLYSWFLYKIFMGIVSGVSEFVASLLQVMILVLVYWVLISGLLSRARRPEAA